MEKNVAPERQLLVKATKHWRKEFKASFNSNTLELRIQ